MNMNDASNSSNIIIAFPDFEKLKIEIDKLRTELSMLVFERDNLLYQECKNIEMAYMLTIGGLEYKVYETECAILRLKRKVELIQVKKNRQEKIILSEIEGILNLEFIEYQEKLDEQVSKMNAALERSHGGVLTESESRELKKLYRDIVKALHPDLHPDISEAKIQLFYNAVEAYQQGDLNGLRVIGAMLFEIAVTDEKEEESAALAKEKERLSKLLASVKGKIVEIKSEYPYIMKDIVQSPEKIQMRKSELEEHIKQLQEIYSTYMERIADMLR